MPEFTWEQIEPGDPGPGSRSRHGLVRDRADGSTLLFGGIVWEGTGRLPPDTWRLVDGEWSPVADAQGPSGRHRGGMAFDAARGFSVLFGGQDASNSMLGDTWAFADGGWRRYRDRWRRRPEARCGHALAFDEELGATVLFGGIGEGDRTLGDTWTFGDAGWARVRGPQPPRRRYAAFAYDPSRRGCVLHGGAVDDRGRRQFGDAWLLRDRAWSRLGPGFETDDRDDHGLAFHPGAGALVMLEGTGGARGVLAASVGGWEPIPCSPLHPRHQCSPLAWDESLDALVMHGGEAGHGGPQFDATLILRARPGPGVEG